MARIVREESKPRKGECSRVFTAAKKRSYLADFLTVFSNSFI